ncbi:hypothetical protein [Kribbella sp. NPDC055071]
MQPILSKLPAALAVLGGVWMLFLFFNSADVTYDGYRSDDAEISVNCTPLGSLETSRLQMDHSSFDGRQAAQTFAGQLQKAGQGDNSEKLVTQLEQKVTADCQEARLDRVALLVLVSLITGLLATAALVRARRTQIPTVGFR